MRYNLPSFSFYLSYIHLLLIAYANLLKYTQRIVIDITHSVEEEEEEEKNWLLSRVTLHNQFNEVDSGQSSFERR